MYSKNGNFMNEILLSRLHRSWLVFWFPPLPYHSLFSNPSMYWSRVHFKEKLFNLKYLLPSTTDRTKDFRLELKKERERERKQDLWIKKHTSNTFVCLFDLFILNLFLWKWNYNDDKKVYLNAKKTGRKSKIMIFQGKYFHETFSFSFASDPKEITTTILPLKQQQQ